MLTNHLLYRWADLTRSMTSHKVKGRSGRILPSPKNGVCPSVHMSSTILYIVYTFFRLFINPTILISLFLEHACMHTYIHACMHTGMEMTICHIHTTYTWSELIFRDVLRTCTHTYIRTYIHTYINTHTHIQGRR